MTLGRLGYALQAITATAATLDRFHGEIGGREFLPLGMTTLKPSSPVSSDVCFQVAAELVSTADMAKGFGCRQAYESLSCRTAVHRVKRGRRLRGGHDRAPTGPARLGDVRVVGQKDRIIHHTERRTPASPMFRVTSSLISLSRLAIVRSYDRRPNDGIQLTVFGSALGSEVE